MDGINRAELELAESKRIVLSEFESDSVKWGKMGK